MPTFYFKPGKKAFYVAAFLIFNLFLLPQSQAELNATLSDGEKLKLIGIGMHQELRNDIYIGALFAPSSVNDVTLLKNENVAKRMSIRIVSKFSSRKMARHWKERLAMNNPREQWQPLTREIVTFSRIFKRNFELGDELNIDHIPGQGTKVYLNGTLFEEFNKPGFMDLLLNVWLGANPPTKAFKKSIRGQDDAATIDSFVVKYSALTPIKGRFDDDLAATSPATKVASVSKQQSTSSAKAQVEDKAKSITASKSVTTAATKTAAVVSSAAVSSPKPSSGKAPSGNTAKAAQTEKQSEPKTAKAASKKPAKVKTASIKAPIAKPDIEEDFFDADLLAGSYTRDLLDSIREYQEYPKKALINREQGDVSAKVVIDSKGEIVDIELVEKSGSRILDRAVLKMVKKAAPFQAIPKELKLNEFEFEVPISFQL